MGFLAAVDFAQQVLTDGFGKECVARSPYDREKPWQHQQGEPNHTGDRLEHERPRRGAIDRHQRQCRKPHDHQDQRSFQ